jgi:hypothetical protein
MDHLEDVVTAKTLLASLGLVLVEIRASKKLELTAKLADVFHNVPSQIALSARSSLLGIENYIDDLIKVAIRTTTIED